MTARKRAQEVHLFGPPRNATGTIPIDAPRSGVVPISLRVNKADTIVRGRLRRVGAGVSELRLRLPRQTPPGIYRGHSRVEDQDIAVSVRIEPRPRVRIHPPQLHVSGSPGGSASFQVAVVNRVNVPLDIPSLAQFDLDDEAGQDRALGRTSRAQLDKGQGRADHFFEEIAAAHGGEASLRVEKGAGTLKGGEERALSCRLNIPKNASGGKTYVGTWDLGIAQLGVVVEVVTGPAASGATGKPRRRAK